MTGVFIVVEGMNGVGKTTLVEKLHQRYAVKLNAESVMETMEPEPFMAAGDHLRRYLEGQYAAANISNYALTLAFAANRADHLDRMINRFLDAGEHRVVICDRYLLSSLVYQPGDGVTAQDVYRLNERFRKPDITLWLQASEIVVKARLKLRGKKLDANHLPFPEEQARYRDSVSMLRQVGHVIAPIDVSGPIDRVVENSLWHMNDVLSEWAQL